MIAGVVHLAAAAGAQPPVGGSSAAPSPRGSRRRSAGRSRRSPPAPPARRRRPRACPTSSTAWSRGRGRSRPSRWRRRPGWWCSFPRPSRTCRWSRCCCRRVMLVALLWGFELNRRRAERAQGKAEAGLPGEAEPAQHDAGAAGGGGPEHGRGGLRQPGGREARACGPARGSATGSLPTRGRAPTTSACRSPAPSRAGPTACRCGCAARTARRRSATRSSARWRSPRRSRRCTRTSATASASSSCVEPEADLALLTEELIGDTRQDERRKLAGLLSHGVDTLIRVLAYSLRAAGGAAARPELVAWLADYVDRRLRTTAWLLDHWQAEPPLPPDSSIEAAPGAGHDRTAPGGLRASPPRDADLRTRLHWDNGVLSAAARLARRRSSRSRSTGRRSYWFTCPVRGGFGFFLGEVLINAIRHGRPGSTPALRIALDRVRRELRFEVENELRERAARPRRRDLRRQEHPAAARPPVRMAGPPVRAAGAHLSRLLARAGERAGRSAQGRLKGKDVKIFPAMKRFTLSRRSGSRSCSWPSALAGPGARPDRRRTGSRSARRASRCSATPASGRPARSAPTSNGCATPSPSSPPG